MFKTAEETRHYYELAGFQKEALSPELKERARAEAQRRAGIHDELFRKHTQEGKWDARSKSFGDHLRRSRQEKVFAGLEMKRRSLDLQMLSVRTLMSALQAAEEARLQRAVDDLPEEMRTEPAARLAALRGARRQAEGHRKEPSRYGATLRQKWLIARRAVLSELKKAAQTADASENDEAD